jgi:hypothetical protein
MSTSGPSLISCFLQYEIYCKNISFVFFHLYNLPFIFQHYQRDIVRGVEGYIVTGSKQVEIGELLKL